METYRLQAHPAFPPSQITSVEARIIGRDVNWLRMRWRIEGASQLIIPSFAGRGRADGLWQTTCFELFLQPDLGEAYCELNLSPSERWNAYDFSARREGMTIRPFPREPECTMRRGSGFAIFDAAIPVIGLPANDCALSITCVLEEVGDTKSYWALKHGGEEPDFHDPACFLARLAAPAKA